ncbi:hypothetical protein BN903_93 [Halorubrum sp. AJ67]|nr:hypothetical protein BN903_93 [Halorubrum sp. AJ67]
MASPATAPQRGIEALSSSSEIGYFWLAVRTLCVLTTSRKALRAFRTTANVRPPRGWGFGGLGHGVALGESTV